MIVGANQPMECTNKIEMNNIASQIAPYFIENMGQINNNSVKYYMKSSGKDIYLTDTEI